MSMMTCPKCGTPNRPNAKFCASCRTALTAQTPIPPPVTPRQPPAGPVPPPVPPRQAPPPPPQRPAVLPPPQAQAVPVTPRQPPRPAAPAKRSFFTRGRILIGAIVLVLLCICLGAMYYFRDNVLSIAGLTTPTPTAMPTRTLAPIPTNVPPTATQSLQPTQPVLTPQPLATTVPPLPTVARTPVAPIATPVTPSPTTVPATLPPTQPPVVATPTDTPPGLVLHPNESWRAGTQVITLQTPKFSVSGCGALFEFDMIFENTAATEFVVQFRGSDLSITNNQNEPYDMVYWLNTKPTDCAQFQQMNTLNKNALDAREKYKVSFQVREAGNKTLEGVEKFYFHVTKAGRITGAKWEIPVPR